MAIGQRIEPSEGPPPPSAAARLHAGEAASFEEALAMHLECIASARAMSESVFSDPTVGSQEELHEARRVWSEAERLTHRALGLKGAHLTCAQAVAALRTEGLDTFADCLETDDYRRLAI